MFKPRLRIPTKLGLATPPVAACRRAAPPSSSPFLAQPSPRCIHAMSSAPARDPYSLPEMPASFSEKGVPGIYSEVGFAMAYTRYQSFVLDNLNNLVKGTDFEGQSAMNLTIMTSREPQLARLFNFASMAFNNHFFFAGIAPTGGADATEHMTPELHAALVHSFGSLENLQREMLLTADAMFGPGFVWLVRQSANLGSARFPYRILTTYLAGSPFPGAHWRRQGIAMHEHGGVSDASGEVVKRYFEALKRGHRAPKSSSSPSSVAVLMPDMSKPEGRPPGAADLIPVLCVNTWEHAYLPDYGIEGKMDYLQNWWNVIHWGKVAERAKLLGARRVGAEINLE